MNTLEIYNSDSSEHSDNSEYNSSDTESYDSEDEYEFMDQTTTELIRIVRDEGWYAIKFIKTTNTRTGKVKYGYHLIVRGASDIPQDDSLYSALQECNTYNALINAPRPTAHNR
jgi:hypothetical protein